MCKIAIFVLVAISVLITEGLTISDSKQKVDILNKLILKRILNIKIFKVEQALNEKLDDSYFGGYDASIGQFPWYAHIDGYLATSLRKPCGGTIISPRFVMTEAFCGTVATRFHIHFGITDFSSLIDPMISDVFIPHPLYDSSYYLANNIGLILLPTSIIFSTSVQAITLPWVLVEESTVHTFFVGTRPLSNYNN